jgi:hypothetical protein
VRHIVRVQFESESDVVGLRIRFSEIYDWAGVATSPHEFRERFHRHAR